MASFFKFWDRNKNKNKTGNGIKIFTDPNNTDIYKGVKLTKATTVADILKKQLPIDP